VGFLEITAADFARWNVRRNGQYWNPVTVAVEQAID